jgi:transposase
MPKSSCRSTRVTPDDVIIGLDLASTEHQVVVLDPAGQRLTRFRIPNSRVGFTELLRRTLPRLLGHPTRGRCFAFEATGHLWEAVANWLTVAGERYVLVNPLATFRVREARSMDRQKTDLTDAEEIAELARTGVATQTQLEAVPYVELRRAWGEYARLRDERARLKTLLSHQLYGFFPSSSATGTMYSPRGPSRCCVQGSRRRRSRRSPCLSSSPGSASINRGDDSGGTS